MKEKFSLMIETLHVPDNGESPNVSVDCDQVIN